MRSAKTWFALPVALLAAMIAACAGGAPGGSSSAVPTVDAGKPQVVIQSPPANAQVLVGSGVEVVTTAVDAIGIGRIDLRVDDFTVSSAEAPPGGLTSFSAVHLWIPASPGQITLSAVAYRADGAPSEPMGIAVLVLPEGASAAPYPTYGSALPTYRASAVPSGYAQPTWKAGPTYAANPTTAVQPTYGATPTDTTAPTLAATPTYAATPTAVATPTYAATTAPVTTTFAWKIPYNGAAEISDSIGNPGDVDRVNYEVTGMNQSPPGNTAHLNVFATCTGSGTENVRFLVGQATFGCNTQVISQLFITNESNTGAIRVTVIGTSPVSVTWTLNGNAAT